ncbi:hypothetical protein OUZ56_000829 [Daphnia magna]|uniref:GMP synthase n=1 Tax=Daphnia magna TaxID=35525 RepID=A0ABR0A0V5_9CRUS|nr:hypothetical protein OUZ56_000829 [Daphnia magna]
MSRLTQPCPMCPSPRLPSLLKKNKQKTLYPANRYPCLNVCLVYGSMHEVSFVKEAGSRIMSWKSFRDLPIAMKGFLFTYVMAKVDQNYGVAVDIFELTSTIRENLQANVAYFDRQSTVNGDAHWEPLQRTSLWRCTTAQPLKTRGRGRRHLKVELHFSLVAEPVWNLLVQWYQVSTCSKTGTQSPNTC